MKIIILLITLFCHSKEYLGEASFTGQSEDQLSFIKENIMRMAFRDAIYRAMSDYNLNAKKFWNHYDEILYERKKEVKDTLNEKYEKKTKYFYTLMRRKLLEVENNLFNEMKLKSVIHSFAIKRFSRSTKYPNVRRMVIQVKMNEKLIGSIYRKFVQKENNENLTISSCLKILNSTGNALNLDNTSIKNVLENRWRQVYLNKALKGNKDSYTNSCEKDTMALKQNIVIYLKSKEIEGVEKKWSLELEGYLSIEDNKEKLLFSKELNKQIIVIYERQKNDATNLIANVINRMVTPVIYSAIDQYNNSLFSYFEKVIVVQGNSSISEILEIRKKLEIDLMHKNAKVNISLLGRDYVKLILQTDEQIANSSFEAIIKKIEIKDKNLKVASREEGIQITIN